METLEFTKQFGLRIAHLRNLQKLTREQLAEKCDCHPNHLGFIERGEKTAKIDMVDKIAKGLNVPVYELFMFLSESTTSQKLKIDLISKLSKKTNSKLEKISKIIDII